MQKKQNKRKDAKTQSINLCTFASLRFFFLTFFCLTSYLYSNSFIVELSTEDSRTPVYLAPILSEGSGFNSNYVKSLENVFRFDLSHNGTTMCLEQEPLLNKLAGLYQFQSQNWENSGANYVIMPSIIDKKLSLIFASTKTNLQRSLEKISLSGNLNEDRCHIHRAVDAIYTSIFGLPGIASTKILYALNKINEKDKEWTSEIFECDYDGANARQITKDAGYCVMPSYIPPKEGKTSSAFLFVSYLTGQPKICVSPLKDFKSQRLSLLRGNQLMPVVSKQRDKIAFISDATGNPDLFLQEFSTEKGILGKPYQAFSTHRATQGTPTISPDGKQLAFVSNKDGNPRIYILNINKLKPGFPIKEAKLITRICRENSAPAWSPDGSKIAYCAMSDGTRQIWIYDIPSDQEIQLTYGHGHKENPSWAPNNQVLVYNTNNSDQGELYLVDLAQRLPTKIELGPGQKRFPSWEPKY